MTTDEMRTAIARVLGWTWVKTTHYWMLWPSDDPIWPPHQRHAEPTDDSPRDLASVTDWPNDLNACFRDLVPMLKQRGWRPNYRFLPEVGECWGLTKDDLEVTGVAPDGHIAMACCLAFLKAQEVQQ